MKAQLPKVGDLVHVTRAASVQFVKPIMCRVIRVLDWITYDGWCWLDVYELDAKGDAVARRSIFVQPAGLQLQRPAPTPRRSTRSAAIPNVRQDRRPAGGAGPPRSAGRTLVGIRLATVDVVGRRWSKINPSPRFSR